MSYSIRLGIALVWSTSTLVAAAEATPAPPKQTVKVAMRDGIRLATDVYLPPGQGPFPVILARTPYNKDGFGGLGSDAAKRGYVMVIQDTRGRAASEGENMPFEADGWAGHWDGLDTVDWVRRQRWYNGKLGTFGGSAVGITQLLLAGTGTRDVTCQHITVGGPSLYHDVIYPGGVFKKAQVEDWLRVSKFSTNALLLWTSHPVHDTFWSNRELNRRYNKVNSAAVHIGGWFDIFAQGTIDAFAGYQTRGAKQARGRQKLLMGPWTHGVFQEKAGDLTFPGAKKPPTTFHDSWRWFDFHLKGAANGIDQEPTVTYYVMGDTSDPRAPGNVWRTASKWPPLPVKETRYYFHSDSSLSASKPGKSKPIVFDYDPRNPAPTVGGPQLTLPAGPKDQKAFEQRTDVLVFTTEVLTEPVEVTGRVRARLWVASDAPDTDFHARLCDVYPDGRSFNICEGQIRTRFRDSFDREKLLKPGKVYPLDMDLWSTSIVFNRSHQIRVTVSSSSAPGYDPNPNTGERFRASDQVRVARNSIYADKRHPSHILLPVALPAQRP